jgi:hypothetical protein
MRDAAKPSRGVDAEAFRIEWHRIVAQRDVVALGDVLADDVSLGAPPYWQKLRGRELVQHLLGLIIDTIEGFTYRREWSAGGELALEFVGRVGELELQGIDLISLNGDGKIQNLDVLMRPVNAVVSLREIIAPQMAAFIARRNPPAD